MAHEPAPEQLLDVFRTAALSVTKLYKSSITAQQKARAAGYQDCLDELLQFLDKENLGLDDGEGWKIRAWANEKWEARDGSPAVLESDDDAEKPDTVASPGIQRSASTSSIRQQAPTQQQPAPIHEEPEPELELDTPIVEEVEEAAMDHQPEIVVPTQETFNFRSAHPYPQDAQNQLNIGNLHLSDNRSHDSSISTPRPSRPRHHGASTGRRPGRTNHLGRGAGNKRHLNFEEFFGLTNLKDGMGGPASKRRHL